MISTQRLFSALFLQVSCVLLTLSTGVFGAAPLLLLKRTSDTINFIFLQLLTITIALYFKVHILALMIFCLSVLILSYALLEAKPILTKTATSVALASAVFFGTLFLWVHFNEGAGFGEWLTLKTESYIAQTKLIVGEMSFETQTLVNQIPSIIFIFFAVNVWVAIFFDSRAQKRMGYVSADSELKNFRTPEAYIWVVIASLLFSFVQTPIPGLQEAALNILNVSLLLYFFQGLSVLSFLMEVLNFGSLLKIIVYFIFVAQLLLPICLGILDFWLNFRNKISKKAH